MSGGVRGRRGDPSPYSIAAARTGAVGVVPPLFDELGSRQVFNPLERDIRLVLAGAYLGLGGRGDTFHCPSVYPKTARLPYLVR
jgi:hypothetical protein